MKVLKRVVLLSAIPIVLFIFYNLQSTGFFRIIKPKFDGKIVKQVALHGAEDITVAIEDNFALVSSTKRFGFPPRLDETGGLYYIDLTNDTYKPILLTGDLQIPFAPHGISMHKFGNTYKVLAINHAENQHSVEVFELKDKKLTHIKTLVNEAMVSPNDLVIIDENAFYFTNDHNFYDGLGRILEDYFGLEISNVVLFDGENYKEMVDDISFANGINIDRERDLVYVASPRSFYIKVFKKNKDRTLKYLDKIKCNIGVDNLEIDSKGNIWTAGHPNLMKFDLYSKGKIETAPSEILKITYNGKKDYKIDRVFTDKGNQMSGSSVAAPYKNIILTGNVMDDHFLILERNVN